MESRILDVVVRNRDTVLFEGPCTSVSSYNNVGKFDVLGRHANFITLVTNKIELVTKSGERRSIDVNNGVCKVKKNEVAIFLGIKKEIKK